MGSSISQDTPVVAKRYPVSASKTTAINIGDHVWFDKANNLLKSAKDFPWQGSLALTQRAFAAVYAGVAMEESPAGSNTFTGTFVVQSDILVALDGMARTACASQTLYKYEHVTLAQYTGEDLLDPAKVVTTTDESRSIGKVQDSGTTQTEIKFAFQSRFDAPSFCRGEVHIPDPGTAAAIPVNRGMKTFLALTIAASASETNTVAAAESVGQELTIGIASLGSGGSRAVTFTGSSLNGSGHSVVTFDAAKEFAVFKAGADLLWNLVVANGATAS